MSDKIDVTQCDFYDGIIWCTCKSIPVGEKKTKEGLKKCEDNPNCYYKQLQQKEQEYKDLVNTSNVAIGKYEVEIEELKLAFKREEIRNSCIFFSIITIPSQCYKCTEWNCIKKQEIDWIQKKNRLVYFDKLKAENQKCKEVIKIMLKNIQDAVNPDATPEYSDSLDVLYEAMNAATQALKER